MPACPACGGQNPGGFRLCGYCGAPLTAPVAERRKLATLLFCDMSGSTALGERVDAESVQELLRSYFQAMRGVVERHGGTVEKFIGDAVVAAFGVPEAHEDDALRACRAALEMQERIVALNGELERRFGAPIAVRIGVNTGEVVTGGAMSHETFVTGDAVNVAARLEQAAAPGEVLLGEPTFRLVRDSVDVEAAEPVSAKGKADPLTAYRLRAVRSSAAWHRAGTAVLGRDEELARLNRELELAVEERRCRLVTVVGEPGVGKSRLAAELVARIGARVRAVRGACLSYGEGITFWAVGQIVRDLAGISDADSAAAARARLDAMLADTPDGAFAAVQVAQLLGIAEGLTTTEELSWAVRRFLAAAAAERPLLVLVDDVQWAEPALRRVLADLPAKLHDAPVLVCCLARPELLERSPGWEVTLQLGPLGDANVESLLDNLGAPLEGRSRLAKAADGNPLFLEELVAWAREGDLDSGSLPTSLNALLGARLDRLDMHARDTLERGAIEGELFHRGAVVELSEPADRPGIGFQLESLSEKDLLRPATAGFAGEVAYRFKHLLVRETAYRGTAKKLRAELHERFADWLERFAGGRAKEYEEILGYHLEQAYRFRTELGPADAEILELGERAASQLLSAGRRAQGRGDVAAAANLLERALAIGTGDPLERARVKGELGNALNLSGRHMEGYAMLRASVEAAGALGERGVAMRSAVMLAVSRGSKDPTVSADELERTAEEAIVVFTELEDLPGLALAGQLHAIALGMQGRLRDRLAACERALAHAEASGDSVVCGRVIPSLVVTFCSDPTPVGEAIRRCEELLESVRPDRLLEASIRRVLGLLHAMAGEASTADAYSRQSSLVLDELNIHVHSANYRKLAAETRELLGDRGGAEQELLAMRSYLSATKADAHDRLAIGAALALADLYCDAGRWEDAERLLELGRAGSPAQQRGSGVDRLVVEARVAAHRGRLEEARSLAEQALAASERRESPNDQARTWVAVAEVRRAGGDEGEADEAVARALELYEQKGNIAAAARLRGDLGHHL